MKARRKGTNEPFQKVASVCLCSGGYILIKDVEFEQDRWQDVRERAAMLAMQSIIPTQQGKYMLCDAHKMYDDCANEAIKYADALVKKLKGAIIKESKL